MKHADEKKKKERKQWEKNNMFIHVLDFFVGCLDAFCLHEDWYTIKTYLQRKKWWLYLLKAFKLAYSYI